MAIVNQTRLVEEVSGWRLPLEGCPVRQCCVDWAVTLRIEHPTGTFDLRIEQPFLFLRQGEDETLLRPEEDPAGLAPVLACTRTTIREAHAFHDGSLVVYFADDSGLTVPGSMEFESWTLAGPAGLQVVSVPGGKLAIWKPTGDE
jgi:hypothetical protein